MSKRSSVGLVLLAAAPFLGHVVACDSAAPQTSGGAGGASGVTSSPSASVSSSASTAGSGGAGGDDGLPEDEPEAPSSSSSGSMLEGTDPKPLPPDHPGGWTTSTLVVSEARMVLDEQDNDRVELGFIELDSSTTQTACSGEGPRAVRTFYSWTDAGYEPGDCPSDKNGPVNFARWDHIGPADVDGCPGQDAFVEDGKPATRPFLAECAPHATSGFGDPAARKQYLGHYLYDAVARTLTFRYDVKGACKKEYFRDMTMDASGKLLSARLDGERTGDTTSVSRGIGTTVGYAFGSPTPMSKGASFAATTDALRTRTFLADAWRFRESRKQNPPQPEHHMKDSALGFKPKDCKATIAYDHFCVGAEPDEAPFLKACADSPTPKTAFLRWLVFPFGQKSPRENLYWGWHAQKAKGWSGCYHRGSHSNPALQVVDADGVFRGYVGVEMQSSADTLEDGGQLVPNPKGYLDTDYRAWRWIEAGYEPIVSK